MTPIPEKLVASLVGEVSERMKDPAYAQVAIGGLVQAHPDVGRWLTAQTEKLGGGEGVMHAVFHAEILAECFRRHLGADLPPVRFATLDVVAKRGDPVVALREAQPALADFIGSNVEGEALVRALSLVALAFDRVAR